MKRTFPFQKRDKKVDDSKTQILAYHSALSELYEILWKAHKHVLKSQRLHSALPSPPRVAFRNPITIGDKVVRFKLKEFIYKDAGNRFESTVTKKKHHITFPFDCNSCYLVFLLTC